MASVVGQLNLYAYCGNNPIMFVDPTGTEWWHWALGAVVVVGLAVLTIVTAGGFAAGMSALMFASYGLATASTATSILAFATVAAGTTLAASAVVAGIDSATVFYSGGSLKDASDVFMQQGEGALYATFSAGLVGAFNGYVANSVYRSLHIQGTSKAKQYEKQPYTVYTKISSSGEDVAYYDGYGRMYLRTDYSHSHGGMQPHAHHFRYWYHNDVLRYKESVSPWIW